MHDQKSISREELYNLVWSMPVTMIAKEFGISDVAIGKICKKLSVPKPGLGYWAKKHNGHKVRRKPLPKMNPGDSTTYTIHKKAPIIIETESETIQQYRRFEQQPKNRVVVKSTLRSSHPLVQQSYSHLNSARPDQYDKLSVGRHCLDIAIGKPSIHRGLLVMDALLKALEKRSYKVSLNDSHKETTSVIVNREQIRFGLFETSTKVMKPKDNKEKRDYFYTPWYYVTTGKLSLRIHEYFCDEKSLSDGKSRQIEDHLNEFILMLIKASEAKRIHRRMVEEERRVDREKALKREKAQRKAQKEAEMVQQLFNNALTWNKCVLAREYITAVRANARNNPGQEVDTWATWASTEVLRIENALLNIEYGQSPS
jgi:hypothetical protein